MHISIYFTSYISIHSYGTAMACKNSHGVSLAYKFSMAYFSRTQVDTQMGVGGGGSGGVGDSFFRVGPGNTHCLQDVNGYLPWFSILKVIKKKK